jgi:hypothetical protein
MKTALKIQWKAYSVAKLGNSPEENEDAFFPEIEKQNIAAQSTFTCAVADGATQTSFSRIWARLLVAAVAQKYLPERLAELTAAAQAQWRAHIAVRSLPWHAEEKVREGAFATLLWLSLQPVSGARLTKTVGTWQALAIGDSCLFQIRKKTLQTHFPPLSAADFKNNPLLLSSNPTRNMGFWSGAQDLCAAGDWAAGDDFFLMTDALAAWFVREQEKSSLVSLITELRAGLSTAERFASWLQELRAGTQIKNDDTTLVWIHIDEKQD